MSGGNIKKNNVQNAYSHVDDNVDAGSDTRINERGRDSGDVVLVEQSTCKREMYWDKPTSKDKHKLHSLEEISSIFQGHVFN